MRDVIAKQSTALVVTPAAIAVMSMLVRHVEQGKPCPTNDQIAREVGAESSSTGARIIAALETANLISVRRGRSSRVVTIVASGKRTAGTVKNPIDYTAIQKVDPAFRWTAARDAVLMQRIADGADFEQAALTVGCGVSQASARFDALAEAMGRQAA